METPDHPHTEEPARREGESLRREMIAILVLYLFGIILPVLIGLAFGPESA